MSGRRRRQRFVGRRSGTVRPVRDRAAAVAGRQGERGQAAVEFVALLPIAVAVALGVIQALAAGSAAELADHAAQSAAVAIAQGRDGADAARSALPGWARSRVEVTVRGTRVHVQLTPRSLLPGLGARLRASASADAGPAR